MTLLYFIAKPKTRSLIIIGMMLIVSFSSHGQNQTPQNTGQPSTNQAQTPDPNTSVTYLNAANFDFTGLGKTNYLGHLNVTNLPSAIYKFGWSAGMMKINYNPDSTSKILSFRNITEDPLKPITVGTKYYKQSSYLSTILTNSAFSMYMQPTFEIWEDANRNSIILLHAHIELLNFTLNANTTYSNTQQEENTYTVKDSISHLSINRGNYKDTSATTMKRTQSNGYFGIGPTFILKASNIQFNFEATYGKTDNFPNFQGYLGRTSPTFNKWTSFYLFRANFDIDMSDKTKLIVGTDIRGLLPDYVPLYAVYIGINLDLSELKNLFSKQSN